MKKTILGCLILGGFCLTAFAQDTRERAEARLMQAFGGTSVELKLAMPATAKGVEIAADKQNSTDTEKNRKRLKTYGTAIGSGEKVLVTGVRVTRDEISFELSGGGAPEGRLGASAGVPYAPAPASIQESRAVARVNSGESGGRDLENVHSTVRHEQSQRQQNNARNQAEYAGRLKDAIERERVARLKMGSRFIIKFDGADTASITPDELKRILTDYVVF